MSSHWPCSYAVWDETVPLRDVTLDLTVSSTTAQVHSQPGTQSTQQLSYFLLLVPRGLSTRMGTVQPAQTRGHHLREQQVRARAVLTSRRLSVPTPLQGGRGLSCVKQSCRSTI